MYIISYDIASKSLALSIIYFNDNWPTDLANIKEQFASETNNCETATETCNCALKYINKINQLLDGLIVPKIFDVVDLIPGKKLKDVDVVTRASRLSAYLKMVDFTYIESVPGEKYKVLLEYQMGPNDKSRCVCSQILYHYVNMDMAFSNSNVSIPKESINLIQCPIIFDIEIIGPSLKNKINLNKEQPYSYFIQKYTKSYDANKAHSKSNFLHWVNQKNCEEMIKNIKKKNLDDISDSVTMTLAWLFLKSNLL